MKRKWDFSKFVQRAPFRGESVSKRIECLAYTTDETKLLVKFVWNQRQNRCSKPQL